MLDADEDVLALLLEQTVVFGTRAFVDHGGQFVAVGLEFSEFLVEIAFPRPDVGDAAVHDFLGVREILVRCGHRLLCRLDLFHQLDLLVVEREDDSLAGRNLVFEGFELFVLLGLELLDGVLLDLQLLGFDI